MKKIITYLFCIMMLSVLLLKGILPLIIHSINEREVLVFYEETDGEKKDGANFEKGEFFDDVISHAPASFSMLLNSSLYRTLTGSKPPLVCTDVKTPPPDAC